MMDKAKAYDEALERARQHRDDYQKELDNSRQYYWKTVDVIPMED